MRFDVAARSIRHKFVCAYCGKDIWRKPSQISNGKSGALAGLMFCNRECQKAKFRGRVPCSWPGCSGLCLVEGANFRRKDARGWFCDDHLSAMEKATGSRKVTARKLEFLSGAALDHRRITWTFVKFCVFDGANGRCEHCGCTLDFGRRPTEFNIDHKVPVWKGGATTRSNLQLLCIPCHKAKSREEQRQVNKTRWSGRPGTHFKSMTRLEKDNLIVSLLARISELESVVASYGDHPHGKIPEQ